MTGPQKRLVAFVILALAGLAWAFHLGRLDQRDRDRTAYINLAAQYDSAVVRIGDVGDLAAGLQDSLDFYHATPRVVTRLVQVRDTVRDTIVEYVLDTLASGPDTALVTFAPQTQRGVTLVARLTVTPIPPPRTHYRLDYRITFSPDTFLLALAQTRDGLDRIVATAVGSGQALRVLEAVQRAPSKPSPVVRGLRMGACLLAGYGLGREDWRLAGLGGAGCGLLGLFR